jgi:TfoX/Sxy family transcriptional regulator of competence genes
MPSFEKSPPELILLYQEAMAEFPQALLRKTFGYPSAYINGNMATGLFSDSMFLRLNPADEAEFLKIPGAVSFAPMKARPMKGYVVIPANLLESREFLQTWIARSLEYAASLPPKEKKAPRKRA